MTSPCVSLPFPACASNDQFMLNCLARRINSRWCSLKIDTWPGPWMWWHPIGELKKYQFSSHMYIILISLYIDNIHWLHGEHCIGELIRIICPFRCRAFSVFQHCSWLFETIDGGLTFRNQQSVFLEVKLDTSYWTPEPKSNVYISSYFFLLKPAHLICDGLSWVTWGVGRTRQIRPKPSKVMRSKCPWNM